jgi:hypothetical protein
MVQSLEEYVAQATNAYQPARQAVQTQLDSLAGKLETANQQINKNYAQQQAGLDRQRNMAAETASLQAAGSGGSFGGAANIANRKYYDRSFVPAQTQLQTNQANELASARQANEDERTNLNSQMANLQAQANQEALNQYWSAVEAEKQREAQLRAARASAAAASASRASRYIDDAYSNAPGRKNWNFGNGYYIQEFVDNAGNHYAKYYGHGDQEMDAGDFVWETNRAGTPWELWNDVWGNGVNTYGINSNDIVKLGGR